MAPITRVKTYSKTKKTETSVVQRDCKLWDVSANNSNLFPVTGASSAVDSLLAKNVEKREASFKEEEKKLRAGNRKSKRLENAGAGYKVSPRFLHDSIKLKINSTFDNLFHGSKYRSVQLCNVSSLCADSSAENSYFKKIVLSPIQNPKLHKIEPKVKIRPRKKKSDVITNGKIVKKNTGKKLSKIIKTIPNNNTANNSTLNNVPKKLYNYLDESINHSLIIERVKPPQHHNVISKSRISDNSSYNCARKFTPIIATTKANGIKQKLSSLENSSFLFSSGFRPCMQAQNSPKYKLLSSTPLVPRHNMKRQEELPQLSPITAKCRSRLQFSNSQLGNSNNLLPANKSVNNKKHSSSSVIVIDSVLTEVDSLKTTNNLRRRRKRSNSKSKQPKDLKLNYTPVVKLDNSLDILGISGKLSLASLKPTVKKNKVTSSVQPKKSCIKDKKVNFDPTVNLTRCSFSTLRKKSKRSKIRKVPNVLLEKLSISTFMKNPKKFVSRLNNKSANNSNNFSNETDNKSKSIKEIVKNSRGRKFKNKITLLEDKKSKKNITKKKNKQILRKGKRKQIMSPSSKPSKINKPKKHCKKSLSLGDTTKRNNNDESYNCSVSLFDDEPVPIRTRNRRMIRSKIGSSPNEVCVQILNNKRNLTNNIIEIIDLTVDCTGNELKVADKVVRKRKLNSVADTDQKANKSTAVNNKPKLRNTRSCSLSFASHNESLDTSRNSVKSFVPSKTNNSSNNSANDSEVFKVPKPIRNTLNRVKNNSFDADKSSNNIIKPLLRRTRSSSVSIIARNDSNTDKSIVSNTFKSSNSIKNTSNEFRNNSFDSDKSPNNIIRPRRRTARSSSVSVCIDGHDSKRDKRIVPNTSKSFNSTSNDSVDYKAPKPIRKTWNELRNNSFDADKSPRPRRRTARSSSVYTIDDSKIDKCIVSSAFKNNTTNDSESSKVPKSVRNTSNEFGKNSFDKSPNNIIRPRRRTARSCSVSACIDGNDSKIDQNIFSNTSQSFNGTTNDSDNFKMPSPRKRTARSCSVFITDGNNSKINKSIDSNNLKAPKPVRNTSNDTDDELTNNNIIRPRRRAARSCSVSIIDRKDSKIDKNIDCNRSKSNAAYDSDFKVPKSMRLTSNADKTPRLRVTRSSSVIVMDNDNKSRYSNFASLNASEKLSSIEQNRTTVRINPRLKNIRSGSVSIDSINENGIKLTQKRISVSDVLKIISFDANKTCPKPAEEFVDFENIVKEFVIESSRNSKDLSTPNNFVSTRRRKNVQFDVNTTAKKSTIMQPSISVDTCENFSQRRNGVSNYGLNISKSVTENGRKSLLLKPGKQWLRSLSILRHTSVFDDHINDFLTRKSVNKGRKWRQSVAVVIERQNQSVLNASKNPEEISNHISRSGSLENRRTTLQIVKARSGLSRSLGIDETDNQIGYVSTLADESILESFDKLSLTTDVEEREETARQIVLRRCGQTLPVLFDECYSQRILTRCRKIGEGVYGEVFMYKTLEGECRVMKIIPIEGDMLVNGEQQKKFEEIISEIVIASELSNLRNNTEFCTDGFNELLKTCCVKGKYPQHLLELWELYDEDHGSENDSPQIFTEDQLYIVLELANGGQDLEAFRFKNAEQSYAVFIQVVCSLAVAEAALEFEHRDMHWGNILICPTDEPTSTFRLNGREFEVATRGVKISIIDFTLSRMTFNNCCIFNDLGLDADLFSATGDYQFDIYRLMQQKNQNEWQHFEPYSNVLWLDYTLEKMITHLRYVRVNSKTHRNSIRRLSLLRKNILDFNSATQFLNSDVFSHMFL